MQNKTHSNVPPGLSEKLSSVRSRYSDMVSIFHCIEVFPSLWVGVAGDGDNGAYEWFTYNGCQLECSDQGYGMSTIALRDVLNKTAL